MIQGNIVMALAFTGPYAFLKDNNLGEITVIDPVSNQTDNISVPHFGFRGDRDKCIQEATDRINAFFDSLAEDTDLMNQLKKDEEASPPVTTQG